MVTSTLFDKYIHLTLMRTKLAGSDDLQIRTPIVGIKPNITIKGSLLPSYSVAMPEVRITNFYSERDLSEFKYIKVEAGYLGGLNIAFEGDLLIPYIEKPSPDSIVVFPMILGNYTQFREAILIKQWPSGTMLKTILNEVASSLKMELSYTAEDISLNEKIVSDGKTKDLISKLCSLFSNLRVQFDSNRLLAYNAKVGRSDYYKIDKLSMAVKKGESLTITGPWIPTMRPGDIAQIDPIFYKQSIGSTFLRFSSTEFITLVIDFSFGTVSENSMIATLINKGASEALDPEGYNG